MLRAVVRADASASVGGGHVVRSFALSHALADSGWQVQFVTQATTLETVPVLNESAIEVLVIDRRDMADVDQLGKLCSTPIDLIVIDSFELGIEFERKCRHFANRVMVIDGQRREHDCDVLLDPNLGRLADDYSNLVPRACKKLLGPQYALLREPFVKLCQSRTVRAVTSAPSILVMLGACDPRGLTLGVVSQIATISPTSRLDVVCGGAMPSTVASRLADFSNVVVHVAPDDVADIMASTNLYVGAAGSTAWECCCLGIPSILLVTGTDQRTVAEGLQHAGAASMVDLLHTDDLSEVGETVHQLINDSNILQSMSAAAQKVCDGQGTRRVVKLLTEVCSSTVYPGHQVIG